MIMKKFLTLSTFFLFLGVSIFAQELEKIAEIEVSSTKKVFTFKLKNTPEIKIEINDNQKESSLTKDQAAVIANFLSIQGVESAIYDKATTSYTVVTNIKTNIELPLKLKK